jgi:Skp family chaperone for outer membrane proteins
MGFLKAMLAKMNVNMKSMQQNMDATQEKMDDNQMKTGADRKADQEHMQEMLARMDTSTKAMLQKNGCRP